MLENATDVYGIDVRASYDAALVDVVDADQAREGVQVQPGNFPQPDFVVRQDVDPQAGTLRYTITQVNPTPAASGSGVLFTVRLRGRGVAGTGEFRIDGVEMSNWDGELLPVQWGVAALQATGGSADGAAAQPTGVALNPTVAPPQDNATATPAANATPLPTTAAQPAVTAMAGSQAVDPTVTAAPAQATVNRETPVQMTTGATAQALAAPVSATDTPPAIPVAGVETEATPTAGQSATAPEANEPPSATATPDTEIAVVGESQNVNAPVAAPATADLADDNRSVWPLVLAAGLIVLAVAAIFLWARRSSG